MTSSYLTTPVPAAADRVMLESKLAFLRQPSSFPESAYRVEAIETHMSWVFLTDGYAYKLKKPVQQELFDFSTVDARHHYCEEEVRLNRRLAEPIYLGTVALSIDARDHLQLGEHGDIIDWLVKMRRLPMRDMLDYALRSGSASEDDLRRVGARLASFYRECPHVAVEPDAYRAKFMRDIDCNMEILSRPAYQLPVEQVHRLCHAQRAIVNDQQNWFEARVRHDRIVEGHGDLRPEHVCLRPEVVVIDCLEFSRDLRIVDPVDELAYLALECDRLGMPQRGASLLQAYGERSGDWPNLELVRFYQGFRAALRARIAILHLDEEKFRYSSEWRRRARNYLRLAQSCQDAIDSDIDAPV